MNMIMHKGVMYGRADSSDVPVASRLDGTAATYKRVMREWFRDKGAEGAAPAELTALCDEWYALVRPDWCGYTEAYQTTVSETTTTTKGGDNEGMEVTPSTDTEENRDDYSGNPLFVPTDVNFVVTPEGNPQITAIDGITSNFKRTDPATYVGVMQMSGWHIWKDSTDTYLHGVSAYRDVPYNVRPYGSAITVDGGVREWVVHAKYGSETVDGGLTSYSGAKPTGYMSHNTIQTAARSMGDGQYSGYTSCDHEFLGLMIWLKYGLTLDGIMAGCLSCSYQYYAQVAESGVKRVILATSDAANLEVGMVCIIGEYNGSDASRATSSNFSISGSAGYTITSIESITIDGTEYAAVYFDTDGATFNTGANGSSTAGTTIVSTLRWVTGQTDVVLGNDGSPISNTSGKYPCKIQGVEIMNGGYEVVSDTIISVYEENGSVYHEPYICDVAADQATSLTANYRSAGVRCLHGGGTSTAWYYIKKNGFKDGIPFPIEIGGSSSTYTRDAMRQNTVTSTGNREMAVRGALNSGAATGGASCVYADAAVSASYWYFSARLSPNGNRGEWAA